MDLDTNFPTAKGLDADEAPLWVPARRLPANAQSAVLKHLLALTPRDRYLRFGYTATDEQIERYVDHIDFERDEVFGVFDRRLDVVALAHLAYGPGAGEASAEFGVSVSASSRGHGFGFRLFEHSVLHARNRGVQILRIHALAENVPMLRIAARAGAVLERMGADTESRLRLPSASWASHLEEWAETGAAEIDFSLKRRALRPADE